MIQCRGSVGPFRICMVFQIIYDALLCEQNNALLLCQQKRVGARKTYIKHEHCKLECFDPEIVSLKHNHMRRITYANSYGDVFC